MPLRALGRGVPHDAAEAPQAVVDGCSKHRLRDKRVLDAAIDTLMEYGWLTAEPLPRKKGTARTTIRYSLTEDGRHHLRGQAA